MKVCKVQIKSNIIFFLYYYFQELKRLSTLNFQRKGHTHLWPFCEDVVLMQSDKYEET